MRIIVRTILPLLFGSSCHSTIEPHRASVAEHDCEAKQHERAADDIDAACEARRSEQALHQPAPCWQGPDHDDATAHRDMAAKHRVASASLELAEVQSCTGVSDDDRAMSPLEHTADIANVAPLVRATYGSKGGAISYQIGATVTLRAVPGLTSEWLQRLVDCPLARNAALGHVVPEMPDCPLVPRGGQARSRSIGNGFAVDIVSDDPDTAREILTRAQRLVASRSASQR